MGQRHRKVPIPFSILKNGWKKALQKFRCVRIGFHQTISHSPVMDPNPYKSPERELEKLPPKPRRHFGVLFWIIVAVLLTCGCCMFSAVSHVIVDQAIFEQENPLPR